MPTPAPTADDALPLAEPYDIDPQPAPAPAPAEPAPAPPKPRHTAQALRLAQSYGFDAGFVEQATPEQLWNELHRVSDWLATDRRQRETQEALDRRPQPQPQPAEPPADELGLDVETYGQPLVESFKTLAGKYKALEAKLAAAEQRDQQRELRSQDDVLDAAFEALGAGYEKFLGKGAGEEIKGTPEFSRRVLLVQAARIDWAKDGPKAAARKIKAAADLIYPAALAAPAAPTPAAAPAPQSIYDQPIAAPGQGGPTPHTPDFEPQAQPQTFVRPKRPDGKFMSDAEIEHLARLQQWASGGLQRPVSRHGAAEPNGTTKATENLARRMREGGLTGESGDADRGDFLP